MENTEIDNNEKSSDNMDSVMETIHDHQEEIIKSMRVDQEYDLGQVPSLYPPLYSDNKMNKSVHSHEPMKGWHEASPKKGNERHQMKEDCGSKCFLEPEREAYPICDKDCNVDCRGLHAAYARARQFGNQETANKAHDLLSKFNC